MTLTITNRELRLDVAYNVRHIGGYRTHDGRTTSESVVRAASLHRLTDAGVRSLAETGVTTVVDLRSTVERERDVTPDLGGVGLKHVIAPVFEQDQSPVGLADEFPGYAVVYQRMLETGRKAYRTLFEVIGDSKGRVLFHCAAGKDRTGVAAALMLSLAGVGDETIVEDYALSGELLAPLMTEWLPRMAKRGIDESRAQQLMASPRGDMVSTLGHISAVYGSPAGYMESIGLSPESISALRARLVA
jgi:protein-tyrosine phosphatase